MKRVGDIFDAVVDRENLLRAFWKASRGKRSRPDQMAYAGNLDQNIDGLREGLLIGDYPIGDYSKFTIYEPKERVICAAAFRERVLHHALMNVCEPFFEKWLVHDTYACRRGKGQLAAVKRAHEFARRHEWFLKCDIRKYFDSIPHDGLVKMLRRKFKDERIVKWFERIIDTYETESGLGLPIGNLTSQHLANLYLDPLDRFLDGATVARRPSCLADKPRACLNRSGSVGYLRYMDDFVFYSDSKDFLKSVLGALPSFLSTLGLLLKEGSFINRTVRGMDFLGLRVWPWRIGASRASLRRYRRKIAVCEKRYSECAIDEMAFQCRLTALTAFVAQGDTLKWRQRFWGNRRTELGSNRVQRGGSWNNDASNCTSSSRNNNNPSNNNGFRLCCSAAPHHEENAVPACFQFVDHDRKLRDSGRAKNQGCPALVGVPVSRITFTEMREEK